jgi:hypothetical protein
MILKLQSLFKAIGRYEFEAEFRRAIDKQHVDSKFRSHKNDIGDICIPRSLLMYLPDDQHAHATQPKFIWNEHMDGVLRQVR